MVCVRVSLRIGPGFAGMDTLDYFSHCVARIPTLPLAVFCSRLAKNMLAEVPRCTARSWGVRASPLRVCELSR